MILAVFAMQLLLCAGAAVANTIYTKQLEDAWYLQLEGSAAANGALSFITFIILLNNLIPISLYITMEIVKFGQAYFINHDLRMYHEASDTPAQVCCVACRVCVVSCRVSCRAAERGVLVGDLLAGAYIKLERGAGPDQLHLLGQDWHPHAEPHALPQLHRGRHRLRHPTNRPRAARCRRRTSPPIFRIVFVYCFCLILFIIFIISIFLLFSFVFNRH
jgi:hypothetical protein